MSKSSNSLRQLHPHPLLSPLCEKLKRDLNTTLAWKWSDYETAHLFSRKWLVSLFKMLFTLSLSATIFFFTHPEWMKHKNMDTTRITSSQQKNGVSQLYPRVTKESVPLVSKRSPPWSIWAGCQRSWSPWQTSRLGQSQSAATGSRGSSAHCG